MSTRQTRRDDGVTLIELLVSIGLLGLIAAVIAAAVTVVFRSEDPINRIVGESHDVQQAVNYFHLDVESGPRLVADWSTAPAAGSGCSTAGTNNVFAYDVEDEAGDPLRRIAYRLTTSGAAARLDRVLCENWNTATSTWDDQRVLNVADRLDTSGGPAVTVSVNPDAGAPAEVDSVTMAFAQSIADKDFAATPRTEVGLAVGPPAAECTDNPLDAALGFGIFVEGLVDIRYGPIEGSLASGGAIRWQGPIGIALTDTNNIGGFTTVAFYSTAVDWAGSTGILTTLPGGSNNNVVLNLPYHVNPVSGGINEVYLDSSLTGPHIRTRGTIYEVGVPYTIDFAVQFEKLRACADVLALLPDGADAQYVGPEDSSGGPYSGGSDLYLDLSGPRTQVLNLFESQLATITTVDKAGSGSPLGASKPLIVNVSEGDPVTGLDDGDLIWDFAASSWSNVGDAKFVLYNFPNTTGTLTVDQDVYGTIFAPYADVVTNGTVQGNVIAKSWLHNGDGASSGAGSRVQNDTGKMFAGNIDFD